MTPAAPISLYCDLIAKAAIDGISRSQGERGRRSRRRRKAGRWRDDAGRALPDLGFEPLAGPRGVADDLKKLAGVSRAIEKQLNDLGIFHYWQIAELRPRQPRITSAKRSVCRAASTAGSPRRRQLTAKPSKRYKRWQPAVRPAGARVV